MFTAPLPNQTKSKSFNREMEEQNKKNQKAKKKTIKRFVLIEEKTMVEENIKINREKEQPSIR